MPHPRHRLPPWAGLLPLVALPLAVALGAPAPTLPPDTRPRIEPATHRNYTETIPGSRVHFDLVAVPGGVFWRGSGAGEKARSADEVPPHPVRLRPFWMGRTEVTWDELDLYWRQYADTSRPAYRPLDAEADAVTRPSPPY